MTITNNEGRALAIEYFSSTDGNMTVTPTNEPGASAVLASQNAFASEMRVKLNTGAFGHGPYQQQVQTDSYLQLMVSKTPQTLH